MQSERSIVPKMKKNYAYPVTATLSALNDYFVSKLAQHSGLLGGKRIAVFGAGTRGSELLLILEGMGYTDVVFCDNNKEKHGGRMNRFPIYSFEEALRYDGGQVFIEHTGELNMGSLKSQVLDIISKTNPVESENIHARNKASRN